MYSGEEKHPSDDAAQLRGPADQQTIWREMKEYRMANAQRGGGAVLQQQTHEASFHVAE
jgi:hypothetical protein